MRLDQARARKINIAFRRIRMLIWLLASGLLALKLMGSPISWWVVLGIPAAAYVLSEMLRGTLHGALSVRDHRA